ncbi:hypothetical protein AZH53_02520 [Methanomicrobiaceae archaeon CYW5]|nr:hypothetical protein [Methanovulcanius yangii]
MMFGIILVGSVFIFLDASIPIIIGGTIAFGIILIMGLGLMTLEDIRNLPAIITRQKDKQPSDQAAVTQKKGRSSGSNENPDLKNSDTSSGIFTRIRGSSAKRNPRSGKAPGRHDKSRDKHSPVTDLVLATRSIKSRFIRSRDSSHGQKIDELLDSTIHEPVTTTVQEPLPVEEESTDDSSIPDLLSDDFDDEDFGLLDDLELDDDVQGPEGNRASGDVAEPVSSGGSVDMGNGAMMSIDAILAENASFDDNAVIPEAEPENDISGETAIGIGSMEDLDAIEVDGGFITLDDDLAEAPFSGSVKPVQSDEDEQTFPFVLPEETNATGFAGSDDIDGDPFGSFSLDELDLNENESLDDLELDMVEEEEDIDSIGLLPDDVLSENIPQSGNTPPAYNPAKKEVISFGGYGDSTSDEIMSFGGGDDDGLLSMLKTDIKQKKTIQDASLVRDMKDTDVDSQDLIEGLEDVLKKMGGKPSFQTNDQNTEM